MTRISLLLVAVALAAGTSGCTHCDTCDDFPTPCLEQNSGYTPATGAYMGPDAGEIQTSMPPASAIESIPASKPATAPAPPPAGGASPHGAAATLDPIPDINPASPPAAPAATLGGLPRQSK
jgi:hypothetical protein